MGSLFPNSQKEICFKFKSFCRGGAGQGEQIILQCRIFKAFLPSFYSCLCRDSCHLGHMNVKAVLVNNENRISSQLLPIHFSEQFLYCIKPRLSFLVNSDLSSIALNSQNLFLMLFGEASSNDSLLNNTLTAKASLMQIELK